MASIVDVRLIDPTEKELAAVLKKAHAAANRGVGVRAVKLERDADFWGRFARDCLREREGRRRSCKAGYDTPEVIAGWWTDPASRRHFRVIGRTRTRWNRMRGEGELRDLPPWWQVYPESVMAVRRPADGEHETYLACCRCGKVGSPESLGWMGDTCGPCFDHRADGGQVARGFGHFPGWSGWQPRVAFSRDGTRLVGQLLSTEMCAVNLGTGTQAKSKKVPGGIFAACDAEGGFLFAYADGAVHRWDYGDGVQRVLNKSATYGRLLLSPDGGRAVVMSHNTGFTADLTGPKPRYEPVGGLRMYANLRFAPGGKRILGLTTNSELVSLNPTTLAETVVRENVFDGITRYGFPHDIAISSDESTAVVVRESYYPPSHNLRVIPLDPKRPCFDLPLPYWHTPNVVAVSPDGAHAVSADPQAGWVGFWKLSSAKLLGFVRAVPEDPSWRGGQVTFSPDGRSLAVMYSGFHQERGSTVVVWPWPEVAEAVAE